MSYSWTSSRTFRTKVLGVAALAAIAALAPSRPAEAQGYFGQNQVQYDRFDWRVLETEHFLIYYYPAERDATMIAARMAERDYARLSRMLDHQFREKKPIVLFASRNDFGQNNVTGDLGEGTGGVTEALRHRMLLNFTGDFRSFEHVLTHEMVHAFQYDVFARGKAGAGLQTLAQVNPPLWFTEGMAEYLSLGPSTPLTNMWLRDAALNGKIPSIAEMSDRPDKYFPYRFGHAFWSYVGQRFGDDVIAQIMNAVPAVGVERAFRRELGVSLDSLGTEWREAMQTEHLPQIGGLVRARHFAQPLLTKDRTGGEIFLAPALSSDGSRIAFLSTGSIARGQVFIDLWLGDARTGQRLHRLVKSTTDPNFQELRLLYSQSAFSPDGRLLAFTAQRRGKDVLYLLDVQKRKVVRRFELPLEGVTGPTWSPDGRQLAFSGSHGGMTDLYLVGVDGRGFRQLTADDYGELQPQWSPDGTRIAFATDRGDSTDLAHLRFSPWRIAVLDLEHDSVSVLPGQAGLNLNPQWSPDGQSLAYISDRTGIANVFLYDFGDGRHYQLTNVLGGVSAITEYSPAISWARGADKLAFTYFGDGEYTVWSVTNPRLLKGAPATEPPRVVAEAKPARTGSASTGAPPIADGGTPAPALLLHRAPIQAGAADSADRAPFTVAQLLDSTELGLPDTLRFRDQAYHVRLQPDYVSRPSIGYTPDAYGRNVYGGTTVVLSDMLGDHRLALSAEVSGRVSEARYYLGYSNLQHRWQYTVGLSQLPYYFLSRDNITRGEGAGPWHEDQEISTYLARQAFVVTAYPLNRFTRVEFGGGYDNVERYRWLIHREIDSLGRVDSFALRGTQRDPTLNYFDAQLSLVSDNTIFGYTAPLLGRRFRLQINPVVGSFRWVEYLADYRRYDPIVFDYLTLATRLFTSISVGPDESQFPKYIARPDFVRGYDRNSSFYSGCPVLGANTTSCSAVQLLGSRVAVANVELRFPLVRQVVLGVAPITLPPVDGVFFYDMGLAWSAGQTVYGSRPMNFDVSKQRYPQRSYGFGLRLNLFNYAVLRWDYAIPMDSRERKGFWTWSLWPGF